MQSNSLKMPRGEAMTDEQRRARHAEDKTQNAVAVAMARASNSEPPPVVVERRTYDGMGWSPPAMMAAEYEPVQSPLPKSDPVPTLTAAEETEELVSRRVAALLAQDRVIQQDAHGAVISHERRRFAAETDKLNRKYDELRVVLGNLLNATTALEKSLGVDDERSAKVIDLPPLPLRGRRG